MTIEEAILELESMKRLYAHVRKNDGEWEAVEMAIAALRAKQQREQLWHDAKTDPPPQNGLYYGAKDDTNSMWSVQYRDGIWTLNAYPEQQMDIVRWAFYDALCGNDDQEVEKNDPLTLDELREMDGDPVWAVWVNDPKGAWFIVSPESELLDNPCTCIHFSLIKYGKCTVYRRPPEKEV